MSFPAESYNGFFLYGLFLFDVIIVAILVLLMKKTAKRSSQDSGVQAEKITSLKQSFEKSINDSLAASDKLVQAYDEKMNALERLLGEVAAAENRLKAVLQQSRRSTAGTAVSNPRSSDDDPYRKAADLIEQGMQPEDVRRRCGLSGSEIDLITRLYSPK